MPSIQRHIFSALTLVSALHGLVVDVHKDWCGPCEVMKPTYRRLFLNLDDAENRVQFLTANVSKLAAFAEFGEDPSVKPLFIMYKVGVCSCLCRVLFRT